MNGPPTGRDRERSNLVETRSETSLSELLHRLDGGPYPRYKQLIGAYAIGDFTVIVDRIPPDPFAGPAKVRLVASLEFTGLDLELVETRAGRVAVEDWLGRRAQETIVQLLVPGERVRSGGRPVRLQEIGAAVLERSACRITENSVELRLMVDLPASGRRIRGKQAEELFRVDFPRLATACLLFSQRANLQTRRAVENVEDHLAMQEELRRRGLVAFVADGSLLARASGAGGDEDAPRRDGQEVPLRELIGRHDEWLDEGGLDRLERPVAYELSRPRRFELAAVLNRWRVLRWTIAED